MLEGLWPAAPTYPAYLWYFNPKNYGASLAFDQPRATTYPWKFLRNVSETDLSKLFHLHLVLRTEPLKKVWVIHKSQTFLSLCCTVFGNYTNYLIYSLLSWKWKVARFARKYLKNETFWLFFQTLWFNMEHGTNGQKGLRKSFVDDKCGLHTKFIFQISKKKVVMLNESGKKSSFGKSQTGAWCRASLRNFFSFLMLENWILNDDVGGLDFWKNLP